MKRTSRAHLPVAVETHAGMTGKNNEDRYAVVSFDADSGPVLIALIADGIGGHQAGERAAELAVDHIMQVVAKSDGVFSRKVITQAVAEASNAIASHAASDGSLKGMGATCVLAWISGRKLNTAYVGDSRMYLLRGGQIQQLTVDHSWVQEAMDKGLLDPALARNHPNVHVIRRYLGSAEPPKPDLRLKLFDDQRHVESHQGVELEAGDILLLCTDGLTDMVWNDEILETVRSRNDLNGAAKALVAQANERGGNDNTTVILIGVPQEKPVRTAKRTRTKKANWLPWILAGLAGVCLLLVLAASLLTLSLLRRPVTPTPTSIFAPVSQVIELLQFDL